MGGWVKGWMDGSEEDHLPSVCKALDLFLGMAKLLIWEI